MPMERMSGILRQIMLSILIGILALALALTCLRGLESPSYLAALALGVMAALAFLALQSRSRLYRRFETFCTRLGKNKCAAGVVLLCFVTGLVWILLIRIEPFSNISLLRARVSGLGGDSEDCCLSVTESTR